MEESSKKMNEEINKEPDKQKDTDLDLENSEKEIEEQKNNLTEEIQIKQEKSEELKKLPLPKTRWEIRSLG